MHGNNLIVIENGQLRTYVLDDKLAWDVGRASKGNIPDIRLYSVTVSRKHGRFQNVDGVWFYLDKNGKNGTVYNGKHISSGIHGRVKPIPLQNGDVFIFGGGEEAVINSKTIWALYTTHACEERWRVEDTKDRTRICFTDGEQTVCMDSPQKGTVIERKNGMGIYMGDITYLSGDISVIEP